MNIELWKQHIADSTHFDTIAPVLDADGKNKALFFSTSINLDRKWMMNHGGWPLSEIAEINNAATVEEQKALLSRLEVVGSDVNRNAGLSDVEIMLSHKSKYLQSASEKISWIQEQIEIRDAKRAELLRRNAQASSVSSKSIVKSDEQIINEA